MSRRKFVTAVAAVSVTVAGFGAAAYADNSCTLCDAVFSVAGSVGIVPIPDQVQQDARVLNLDSKVWVGSEETGRRDIPNAYYQVSDTVSGQGYWIRMEKDAVDASVYQVEQDAAHPVQTALAAARTAQDTAAAQVAEAVSTVNWAVCSATSRTKYCGPSPL